MSPAAPATYRPATADDVPRILALVAPDPASRLNADTFRERLATGEYRPEWTWLAETGRGPGTGGAEARADGDGLQAAAIWWGDTGPNGLDALVAHTELPRDQRVAVASGLLAAAHRSFDPSRTTPAFHVTLPLDWRARHDVVAALSWRWEAAVAAGLTDELERLRFEWTAGTPVPEPDDEVFTNLFQRTLAASLDATSRRMADVVGEYAQASSDVAFYRDRMPGDRRWWFTASTPDGAHAGFGVPSRNSQAALVVGYLGVLPEHRGHGYIDDILAEVTRILAAEARADVIYADTDVANKPMAAAFERAGYRNTARRVVLSAPLRLALSGTWMRLCGQVTGGAGRLPRQRRPGEQGRGHHGRSGCHEVTGADQATGAVNSVNDVTDAESEQECGHNAQERAADGEGEPGGQQCGPCLAVNVQQPPRREDQEAEPACEQMVADDFLEVGAREGPRRVAGNQAGIARQPQYCRRDGSSTYGEQ
jgi:RimJ/RimL family protein N-acetyltransferase